MSVSRVTVTVTVPEVTVPEVTVTVTVPVVTVTVFKATLVEHFQEDSRHLGW